MECKATIFGYGAVHSPCGTGQMTDKTCKTAERTLALPSTREEIVNGL